MSDDSYRDEYLYDFEFRIVHEREHKEVVLTALSPDAMEILASDDEDDE